MKKLTFVFGLFMVAILTGCVKEFKSSSPIQDDASFSRNGSRVADQATEYVPNELLIKFTPGTSPSGVQNALAHIGGNVKEHIVTNAMRNAGDNEGLYLIKVPNGVTVALERAKMLQDVEIAEPNYIYRHIIPFDDSNDPYYSSPTAAQDNLWGMMGELTTPYKNSYASRAGEAWSGAVSKNADGTILYDPTKAQHGSNSVYVAVIDEGIDFNHEDLSTNIWTNLEEIPDNKIDDDGDGYVDDLHGFDFYHNDGTVYDAGEDDHGTHVAGTIGAIGNNNTGVAGICWNVTIISAKFLGPNGGTTDGSIKAIDYVTNLKSKKGLNIVATNNSWGGGSKSSLVQQAIERANNANILFVAAAGNSGVNTDKRPNYPSCYSNTNIISVASITVSGAKSSFSNYGLNTVDIAAPGSYVWSSTPNNTYSKFSGTSMATPHVTGAVALYASVSTNAGKTAAQIKNAILTSARPTKSFQGLCVTGGRLDVSSALQNINNKSLQAN